MGTVNNADVEPVFDVNIADGEPVFDCPPWSRSF